MLRFKPTEAQAAIAHLLIPWLFSVYPVIFLYTHNIEYLHLRQLLAPLGYATGLAIVVFAIWKWILKENVTAALSATLFVVLFWNYDLVSKGFAFLTPLKYRHILPLSLLLYGHIVYGIKFFHRRFRWDNLNKALCAAGAILVAINLLTLIPAEIHKRLSPSRPDDTPRPDSKTALNAAEYPDIYFIILDEYARFDTLREAFGYDNNAFHDFLTESGFFVAHKSKTTHAETARVLASLMSLGYVAADLPISELYRKTNQSALFAMLHGRGYGIVYLDGWARPQHTLNHQQYRHAYINKLENANTRAQDDFRYLAMMKTFLGPMLAILSSGQPSHYFTANRYYFQYLADFPFYANRSNQPHLVFAHLMCPHLPFVFDRNGNFSENPTNHWEYADLRHDVLKRLYLEQLIYVTQEMQRIIAEILERSATPPVIVLCSDHGPRKASAGITNPKQYQRVLNAVYFPDGDYSDLDSGISPVESLQVIMRKYFENRGMPEQNK